MLDKITVLILLVCDSLAQISINVTVNGLGNVIGSMESTAWTSRDIYAFKGIPYAQPPIGDLRFRPPVKVTTWNGTLYATEFGSICPQNPQLQSPLSGNDEDCLTLNVYVPEVRGPSSISRYWRSGRTAPLPVMIWIHGGTFMSGFAQLYEPNFILEEDVILVVPQFRLGPLGLLCLQTDEIPGNVQFLDQIMAMRWVRDNIGYFGGDPNQVTLWGQSSGAATVNLHQFSPLSKGLFHRAIIQSGSAFAPWVMDHKPVDTATKLGAVVGCTQTNLTELAACFKGLEVQTLIEGFDAYLALHTMEGLRAFGGNRAVIQTAGTQRFLEEDPSTLLARSEYSRMPMIGGANRNDGSYPFAMYHSIHYHLLGLDKNEEFLKYNMTPSLTALLGMTDESGGISQTLTYSYFKEGQIGNFVEMAPGLIDIVSVFAFKAPVFKMLQENSRGGTSYLYTFRYFGTNKAENPVDLPFGTGVGHSDELFYLFPKATLAEVDKKVAKGMVSLWTSFAITGIPAADGRVWEPMDDSFGPFLIIDEQFFKDRYYLSDYTIASREGLNPVDRSDYSRKNSHKNNYGNPYWSHLRRNLVQIRPKW